jgi:hypothetical protein
MFFEMLDSARLPAYGTVQHLTRDSSEGGEKDEK